MEKRLKCLGIIVGILLGVLVVSASIALAVYFFFVSAKPQYGTGAVVSNGVECAEMGRKIFEAGGNVADVAVTTVLCEGVSNPASCGIGGGFILTMSKSRSIEVLNARERAPINATPDMFVGNPEASTHGGKAVAVPGGLSGLWELYRKHGTLKWKDLLQPVIDMCRNGHRVSPFLEEMLDEYADEILAEPSMKEIFVSPVTGKLFRKDEVVKRTKLAETLEVIANEGIRAMYGGGAIGKRLVEDVRKYGGIMVEQDLMDYRVEWTTPERTMLPNGFRVETSGLPSSGSLLIFLLELLRNDKVSPDLVGYQRMIEALKLAFAHRTHLGMKVNPEVNEILQKMKDLNYVDAQRLLISETRTRNDAKYYGALYQDIADRGTAHVSILAPNGDAIAVTDTINNIFGAMFRSQSTGIILNDEMDDFAVPGGPNEDGVLPSPNNFVIPGNNPLSSMIPTIVFDDQDKVRLIIGAAGGRTIISSTYYVLFRNLFFNETLDKAISAPRFHHQLTPMELLYEENFDKEIIKNLSEKIGHNVRAVDGIANVVGIAVENGKVNGCYDPSRGGSVAIFEGGSERSIAKHQNKPNVLNIQLKTAQ